ncbi:MAG: polyprenyl synthetase family protein [Candidatus Desulforudis sp.]|nr:polyprenyl synthetase family protein [Desulforudis sp.]
MLPLLAVVRDDLDIVERELYAVLKSPNELLAETSSHLFRAGGKRLRPAFALLAAKFHDYDLEKVLPVALALELAHMATLVHDDVVDGAGLRRGIPSVKALWGNRVSTHTGDYLFAKSMIILLSNYRNPIFIDVLAHTCVKMCEGEIIQFSGAHRSDLRDYLRRIRCKTALLIRASCQLGAVATGAPAEVHTTLGRFGYCFGMAFQITDDVLDMVADQELLGKPVGGDLRQGVITLPVIMSLFLGPDKERLSYLVGKEEKTEDDIQEIIRRTKECGGIDAALGVAEKYLAKACTFLEKLPDIPARRNLFQVAEFVRVRDY